MGNNRSRNILIISGLFVMLLIAVFLIYNGRRRDYDERIVGFIMNGRIDENGWNAEQYAGIKEACDDLDIKLLVRESIKEGTGKCREAIEELIGKGAGAIVLLSYNYVQEADDVIKANKNIVFYTIDAESIADNVIPYFQQTVSGKISVGHYCRYGN